MATSICNAILEQSTAVRTYALPEVNTAVRALKCDLDAINPYTTNIKQWLNPVIDLEDFYVYPTNGITEGLNWWMANETRSIYMDDGDYQWVVQRGSQYDDCIKYMSSPACKDGNFKEVPTHTPIALDLAYVGSTIAQPIEISDNVEYVFYSLSKAFGLRNVRTGWIFTRSPDQRLEAITHSAKYYNYFAHNVAETVINKFDIEYIWRNREFRQHHICREYGFTPSDSVWLATTNNPAYDKFKRDGVNRVCLVPSF